MNWNYAADLTGLRLQGTDAQNVATMRSNGFEVTESVAGISFSGPLANGGTVDGFVGAEITSQGSYKNFKTTPEMQAQIDAAFMKAHPHINFDSSDLEITSTSQSHFTTVQEGTLDDSSLDFADPKELAEFKSKYPGAAEVMSRNPGPKPMNKKRTGGKELLQFAAIAFAAAVYLSLQFTVGRPGSTLGAAAAYMTFPILVKLWKKLQANQKEDLFNPTDAQAVQPPSQHEAKSPIID